MIPLSDDNPKLLKPVATVGIIVLNILVWLFAQGAGTEPYVAASVCVLGIIPGELLQTLPAGTSLPIAPGLFCVLDAEPNWYTLVSYMFLHGSWMHLLGNLWFLWVFGRSVEDSTGPLRFVAFYLISGLAAAALQLGFSPASGIPMVGASGAIGGVMGAYLMLYPRVRVTMLIFLIVYITTISVPAMFMLLYWLFVQFIGGLGSIGNDSGGVAFWAHIGGFVTGAAMIWLFVDKTLLRRHPHFGWRR